VAGPAAPRCYAPGVPDEAPVNTEDFEDSDLAVMEPSGEPQPTRRKPRMRHIFIIAMAALAVIFVVVGLVTWHFLGQQGITLAPADTVSGLTLDTGNDAKDTSDYLRNALGAKIGLDNTVGAVYRDPANKDHDVLFFGGTSLVLNPAKDLDQAFSLLNDSSGTVTGIQDVPPGTRGGVMRCGTSNGDGGPMVVCGWADRGSLAMALFPGRSMDEAAQLLRDMRTAIEHG